MAVVTEDTTVQPVANKLSDLDVKKAGDLALAKIDLFVNNITPGPTNVLSDFTIATFTGYAQKAVAGWTADETNADGSVGTTATTVLTWQGPADATGQTITGYLIRAAAGGGLIAAVKFTTPQPLAVVTDVLNLVPTFRVP